MSGNCASNMAYIQQLFTTVQHYVNNNLTGELLFSFLDAEPAEFRSIAYESASMEIGMKDMQYGNSLVEWQKFYQHCRDQHSFHVQIGLGWAFAKTETLPHDKLVPHGSIMRLMVFDGIGYFNGLFRGRRTIKHQIVPDDINENDLTGFDQGLGRRLWYISQANVDKASDFIKTFPGPRQSDLWRGIGIACGYVGGNTVSNLQILSEASGIYHQQLCTGIALAVSSRHDSNSITPDIESTCEMICKMTIDEMLGMRNKLLHTDGNDLVETTEMVFSEITKKQQKINVFD